MYTHQMVQFYAPLSALAALGAARVLGAGCDWKRAGRVALAGVLGLAMFLSPMNKYRIRLQQDRQSQREAGLAPAERVGAWLAREVPPGETIYVLGQGVPAYLYSGRRAPTRYFQTLLLPTAEQPRRALADLRADPPRALVITPSVYPWEREFSRQVKEALLAQYVHRSEADAAPYEVWVRGGREGEGGEGRVDSGQWTGDSGEGRGR
jgi:hypothetical protein